MVEGRGGDGGEEVKDTVGKRERRKEGKEGALGRWVAVAIHLRR